MLTKLLRHPSTKNLSIDDPSTTIKRKNIIQNKGLLKKIYLEWYKLIANELEPDDRVLELGSGAGFFKKVFPNVISSEVFDLPFVDKIVDARNLPFEREQLSAIVMTDVFHHIPEVEKFLLEAERCLAIGGKILMVEPWPTTWSKFIFKNFHSEPFDTTANWDIPSSGPLSGANGALPWIVFKRDHQRFISQFPSLKIRRLQPLMPLVYILSGGVSIRSLSPGFTYRFIRSVEKLLPLKYFSMFAFIIIEKVEVSSNHTS